jgi:hypothetical protein
VSDKTISVDVLAANRASSAFKEVAGDLNKVGKALEDLSGKVARIGAVLDDRATPGLKAVDQAADRVDGRTAKVNADAETGAANTKLRETERQLDKIDGRRAEAKVDVDTVAAMAKIAALSAAIASLSMVGIAGLGMLAGAGAVLAGGLAVGVGATQGLGAAVDALGKKSTGAGSAVTSNAAAIRSAMRQVEAAHRDVAAAAWDVGSAERALAAAARDVTTAQRGVEAAERGVADAHRAVDAAARGVVSAQRAVEDAARSVTTAERALADAQGDERRAQESLTQARRDAARQLQDLQMRTEDMALAQKDAALSVLEAEQRARMARGTVGNTQVDVERADLGVDQAKQRQRNLQIEAQRLAEDKASADRKGVEGSDLVVAAQDRLVQAQKRVADATQGIADAMRRVQDAQQGVADAQQRLADAQQGVIDAEQRVADAVQHVADAQDRQLDAAHRLDLAKQNVGVTNTRLKDSELALAEAHKKATAGAAGGTNALADAMAKLSPEGQKFAKFMRGFIDGPLKDLRFAAQDGLFPGLERGLKEMEPTLKAIEPAVKGFAKGLGDAFANIAPRLAELAGPFLEFATAALEGLKPLGPIVGEFARGLGWVFRELDKSGATKAAMEGFAKIFGALLPLFPPLIDAAVQVAAALGPGLAEVVKQLVAAIVIMLPEIVKLAPIFAQWLINLAPLLPQLGMLIAAFIQLVIQLSPFMLAMSKAGAMMIGVVLQAFVKIVGFITDSVVPIWNTWQSAANKVHKAITSGVDTVVKSVLGLPGRVKGALSGVFSPLWEGFRSAYNRIVSGWNRLSFGLPGGSFMGVSWGGLTIDTPDIPMLAQGGVVTRPTLAIIGEAGPEAVVPLSSRAGREAMTGGGSTIVVNVYNAVIGHEDAIQRVVIDAIERAQRRGYGSTGLAGSGL